MALTQNYELMSEHFFFTLEEFYKNIDRSASLTVMRCFWKEHEFKFNPCWPRLGRIL